MHHNHTHQYIVDELDIGADLIATNYVENDVASIKYAFGDETYFVRKDPEAGDAIPPAVISMATYGSEHPMRGYSTTECGPTAGGDNVIATLLHCSRNEAILDTDLIVAFAAMVHEPISDIHIVSNGSNNDDITKQAAEKDPTTSMTSSHQ